MPRVGKEERKLVEQWRTRIGVARKFREADNRKAAWENMKKYYRNFFDQNVVSVGLIYSHGRQLVPFL